MYKTLDAHIVQRITDGNRLFTGIWARDVWDEAGRIAKASGRPAWTIVDGRLQALRKAGRIKFERGPNAGWVVVA